MNTFFHTGDLGDIIASLPTVREMDGGDFVIGFRPGRGFCRETMAGKRFEAIKPLLEAQPYIKSVSWGDYRPGMIDFSTFRQDPGRPGENLATRQARYIGVLISLEPWLKAHRYTDTRGRTIIARSSRYHNPNFDWQRHIQNSPLFVGTRTEHEAFQIYCHSMIEYLPTGSLLDLAGAIHGADLFVGNQSCPFWVAAGLGVPLIQETSPKAPDSIIERENASYPVAPYELVGRSA